MAAGLGDVVERISAAAATFDHPAVAEESDRLAEALRRRPPLEAEDRAHAETLLGRLRRKRYFAVMRRLGDALIQTGSGTPKVRRQYAQALIDSGDLSAAILVLEALERATRGEDPGENAEARGLLGRAHKQRFVDALRARRSVAEETGDAAGEIPEPAAAALASAVDCYRGVYRRDPARYDWHGINTAACLALAGRHGVATGGIERQQAMARKIAGDILARIRALPADALHVWAYATALEACVALDDLAGARRWLSLYVSARDPADFETPQADAFEIASTLRQLEEVWELDTEREPGASLLPLMRAALLERQGGEVAAESLSLGTLGGLGEERLEAVLGEDSFQTFNWFRQGIERARAVARIGFKGETRGEGTGFLIRGRDLDERLGDRMLLLTNAHVVSDDPAVDAALRSDEASVVLQSHEGVAGQELEIDEILWTSPPGRHDATLLRLREDVGDVEPYRLHRRLPNLKQLKQRVYIIGHPRGGTLSFSIQDNALIDHEGPTAGNPPDPAVCRLHYRAPTEGGSSGSPVFDGKWRLIGLHHKGGTGMPKLNRKPGRHAANEAIWIQSIVEAIRADPQRIAD